MAMLATLGFDVDVINFVVSAFMVGAVVLHLLLAMGVMFDAVSLERRRPLWFLGALSWAAVVLFTGLVGTLVYWLMHHSTLAGDKRPATERKPREIPLPNRSEA